MAHWSADAVFYHIYPLGLCDAPAANDHSQHPVHRLAALRPWVDHCAALGATAIYLGPVFESCTHGYDTADYFTVDRRLGTNDDLRHFVSYCHERNIRVVLDAVFNHVGRRHHAFRHLVEHGADSTYRDWFMTDFSGRSPFNDSFRYECWNGHHTLVKLNLSNPGVRSYLFSVVQFWADAFDIDGLRLDAADSMEKTFFNALHTHCRSMKQNLWLMGEVIHGDYNEWASAERLDSVTNYELYKGLWSSHNDANYFEIAYSANRQFGDEGLYRDLPLYTFADNHDVERVGSILRHKAHLYPLHILLFTLPGIPSLYYGSEWGIGGKKTKGSDAPLRPALDIEAMGRVAGEHDLSRAISTLIRIRSRRPSLRTGKYVQIHVAAEQYAFQRVSRGEMTIVAVNSSARPATISCATALPDGTVMTDILNNDERFSVRNGRIELLLNPNWGRILAA